MRLASSSFLALANNRQQPWFLSLPGGNTRTHRLRGVNGVSSINWKFNLLDQIKKRRGPNNGEDPCKQFSEILDMESISFNEHEMEVL